MRKRNGEKVNALKQLKIAKSGYILISVVFYITGICSIFFPEIMTKNLEIIAGIILFAYGIIKNIGYFSKDLYCLAFQYDFAGGIFLMALGVLVLCFKGRYDSFCLLAGQGILILLDSLLSVQTSLDARKFGMKEWKWILGLSILAGMLGILLMIRNTLFIAGCALLAEGGMKHYLVHSTVKISGKGS